MMLRMLGGVISDGEVFGSDVIGLVILCGSDG
jgi:hypothetical protein